MQDGPFRGRLVSWTLEGVWREKGPQAAVLVMLR